MDGDPVLAAALAAALAAKWDGALSRAPGAAAAAVVSYPAGSPSLPAEEPWIHRR